MKSPKFPAQNYGLAYKPLRPRIKILVTFKEISFSTLRSIIIRNILENKTTTFNNFLVYNLLNLNFNHMQGA